MSLHTEFLFLVLIGVFAYSTAFSIFGEPEYDTSDEYNLYNTSDTTTETFKATLEPYATLLPELPGGDDYYASLEELYGTTSTTAPVSVATSTVAAFSVATSTTAPVSITTTSTTAPFSVATTRATSLAKNTFAFYGTKITEGKYRAVVNHDQIELHRVSESESEDSSTSRYPSLETNQNKSKSFVEQMQEALRLFHLNSLKHRTQHHLVALQSLLSILEEIKRNMTLLQESPASDLESYFETAQKLGNEMVHVEDKLVRSRQLIAMKPTATDPQSLLEAMQGAHALMTSMVVAQREILLLPLATQATPVAENATLSATTVPDVSIEAVKRFLDTALEPTMDVASADKIMAFMEKVSEGVRVEGYKYLLDTIARNRPREDPLTVRVMGALQKYPSIAQQMSSVPALVRRIFTNDKKCIKMRNYSRYLQLEPSVSRLVVNTKESFYCSQQDWTFRPVEDGKYYLITHPRREMTIGLESAPGSTASGKRMVASSFDTSLETNPAYQWRINLVFEQSELYLQFINRDTGLLLDADIHGFVYPHVINHGANQHWRIFI